MTAAMESSDKAKIMAMDMVHNMPSEVRAAVTARPPQRTWLWRNGEITMDEQVLQMNAWALKPAIEHNS